MPILEEEKRKFFGFLDSILKQNSTETILEDTKKEGELKKEDYSSKQHVKAFVDTYLKKYGEYDAEKVYRLRCSLVHNYTLSGYEVVEHDLSKRSNHLTKDSKNRYWLHLGSAIEDLEKAVEDYMNDVKKHDNFKINAYEYYTVHPLLKPMDLKDFASLSEPLVA